MGSPKRSRRYNSQKFIQPWGVVIYKFTGLTKLKLGQNLYFEIIALGSEDVFKNHRPSTGARFRFKVPNSTPVWTCTIIIRAAVSEGIKF